MSGVLDASSRTDSAVAEETAAAECRFQSPQAVGLLPLAFSLVRMTLAGNARLLARRLGIGRPERLELADLAVPETRLAHDVAEWAGDACPKMLLDHGRRGFLFADAIARYHRASLDREALYLGCLLHDLGLAARFDRGNEFERDGADAAVDVLGSLGVPRRRLGLVREIIELHDAPHQAPGASPETRFAHFGIGLDILGARRSDIHRDTLRAVVDAWPRGSFRNDFVALMDDQAARKPGSHIARLMRLGLGDKIRSCPIPDGAAPAADRHR